MPATPTRRLGDSDLEVSVLGLGCNQPAVASVIAGATKPEQVHANARAVRWTPGTEDLEALRGALVA